MKFTSRTLLAALIAVAGCTTQSKSTKLSTRSNVAAATMPTSAPSAAISVPPVDPALEADAKKTLTYLSSDELEGRGVGTHGLDLAADFIADRFHSLGLKPVAGNDGYFQPFDFPVPPKIKPSTKLIANDQPIEIDKSFRPLSISSDGNFDGDAVFVGYGISQAAEHNYDDYAGIDVKGKVVIALRYEPIGPDGNSRLTGGDVTDGSSFLAKAETAKQHGAVALVFVDPPAMNLSTNLPTNPPTTAPTTVATAITSQWSPKSNPTSSPTTVAVDDTRRREMRRQIRMTARNRGSRDQLIHLDAIGKSAPSAIPIIQLTQKEADELLHTANAPSLLNLEKTIDDTGHPDSMVLNGLHLKGEVGIDRGNSTIKNVMAILPGKGPHSDEFVVVGAHYDHLGHGGLGSLAPTSHEIHHGADDNGSGTTSVLELATKMAHAGPLQRSVLFVTFSAEEEGLIGSAYFVSHPPIPLAKIVAMLNMDMVGRLRDESLYVGGSGTAPEFESMLKTGDDESPLKLLYVGPLMNKGGMGPSDHQSFAMKKIPVVFFFTGLHRDYHTPTDTVEKINFDGMAEIISLGEYVLRNMAEMPHEAYVDKFDEPEGGGMRRGNGITLGVSLDTNAANSVTGVPITGTRPGSPAEKAGLKDGDVITKLNDTHVETIYDLTEFLSKAKSGDEVKIEVDRDKHSMTFNAMLGERPTTRAVVHATSGPTSVPSVITHG